MSLSVVERREFLAFAALVERADTPELRLALASGLRLWVDAKTRRPALGDEQLALLDDVDDASTTVADVNDDRRDRRRRELSTSKGAIYQRARRAQKKAEDAPATPTTIVATVDDDRRGTRSALSRDLSISNSNQKEISRVRARDDVADPNDPERPEPEDLEAGFAERPDLPESIVRRSWRRFARANPWGTLEHWQRWIRGEDVTKTGLAPAPCTPPKSERRPIVRAELAPCDVNDALLAAERATGPPVRAPAVA